jgi:predicted nucleic acid-binding Zn ribbon protein
MPALMYRCPSTGMNVEVWYEIDDDPSESADRFFETVVCYACGQVHLVDPKNAEVAGTGKI